MGTSSETKQIVSNPYVINIDRNLIFSALIKTLVIYTITVEQPENGVITVNDEVGTTFVYSEGTEITIKAVPNEGFELYDLYVDEEPYPSKISFTFTGTSMWGSSSCCNYCYGQFGKSIVLYAEEGMTFAQWVDSVYNTIGFNFEVLESRYDHSFTDSYGNSITKDTIIVSNETYTFDCDND